ncbi:alpha/beta hydrolase family protein [Kordiimonas gwangyangensis]|uniref:alpha/beta hydrolase family protein n=1 Tax=Kordiimonas gwangyangensis TaxID=288022 RepID=UPI000369D786|nr:alpha/beta fold hydrolase [Kordiimonas gwangyangensis]
MTAEWHMLEAEDSTTVPVQIYTAIGKAKATALMLPALGIAAKFYRRLAEGLAGAGIDTVLMEQRGHGESPYRAKRGQGFGYTEFLDTDVRTALDFARGLSNGRPLYMGGHSLGGHMSAITAGRDGADIAGVIQLACGFPYTRLYSRKAAGKIKTLCALIPPVTFFCGFFPGDRVGFGGREYSRLMRDWRDWALHGTYDYGNVTGVEDDIAAYKGRVLSIAFEDDFFASDLAVEYSHSRLKNAEVTAIKLGAAEQGEYLGHFNWARKPDGAVAAIVNWIGAT